MQRNAIVVAVALMTMAGAAAAATGPAESSAPVIPGVFAGDVRTLPTVSAWQPGEPVREGPRRRDTHPGNVGGIPPRAAPQPDPVVQGPGSAALLPRSARTYSPPELNFDAQDFTGVEPPDTVGDVGSRYFIQIINGATGSPVTIYDKVTGNVAAGPFLLQSLWSAGGPCTTGGGDPIVLFDTLASRWLLTEFASTGNHLCVYVSRSNDPVGGGWVTYDFIVPDFPDYPKYAVWPDAYYVTSNETDPAAYALDRTRMLAGLPASFQRFTAPPLGGFSFQALTPADLDGRTPPPAGAPGLFLRHVDDELHSPGSNDPAHDFLELWQLHADFANPGNSTFTPAGSLPVAEFNSSITGIGQQGTGVTLDPIREVVMFRVAYRNFGTHETLVGNFVTDVSGAGHAGVRWFELRRSGGPWSVHQEGTYAPDAANRWLGAIAMDGSGNMALGVSISGSSVFPGMRYTGRLAGDPLAAMTQPEVTVVSGAAAQTTGRWGDYASMSVDPIDDCTFWFTNEYIRSNGLWRTRIARFRYATPTCTAAAAPACGNGVREVGEDCDGADNPFCPGLCRPDCTCPAPTCGNDVREVGEECDGTSTAGCGTGTCTSLCTCARCAATPLAGCRQASAGAASVIITDNTVDDTRDTLKWSWKRGDATQKTDFGNPVTGGVRYATCVYDASAARQPLFEAQVPAGGTCGTRACWSESPISFKYSNRAASAHGILKMTLQSGAAGAAQVLVRAKGVNLGPPNPPLVLPVTVQLVADTGSSTACWQTRYTTSSTNDDVHFKANGP